MISGFNGKSFIRSIACAGGMALFAQAGIGGEADVVDVVVTKTAPLTYTISVSVAHDDEGWSHYADSWVVSDKDGNELATRILLHPHVDEQPFTRSMSGIEIPDNVCEIVVYATDLVHHAGGSTIEVDICALTGS